jgi:uncharacterized protein YjiS (DUF1127 family)
MMRRLAKWWSSLRRARAADQARREMRALSDRALRDIGLERGQIELLFR